MRSHRLVAAAAALVLAALPLLLALADPGPARKGASPGKPQAPVEITAELRDGGAHLALTFAEPAAAAEVKVYGTGGLRVTSPEAPVRGRDYAAGASESLEVTWSEAPAGATLAVSVSARFGGARRARVASFTVRDVPADATKAGARLSTDAQGRKVRSMPGVVK